MAQLVNRDGVTVFDGEITGVGSTPVQAVYSGDPVTIADGDDGRLTWDNLDEGVDLLDRSVLNSPVLLASSGTYAVTVTVYVTAPFTAGGSAQVGLGAINVTMETRSAFDKIAVSAVAVIPEGLSPVPMRVTVFNFDGAAARDFGLAQVSLVKLA